MTAIQYFQDVYKILYYTIIAKCRLSESTSNIYFEYNIIYIHVSIDIICFNHQDGLEAIRHEERAAAAARQATTLGL